VQYITANQGDAERAKDIFHDGMIIFDRNIQEGKFRGEGSPEGYLYSICRFLWMKALEKEGRMVLKDDDGLLEDIAPLDPEDMIIEKEKEHLLDKIIARLGERCKKLLELWKLSYSMDEIAGILNFSSAAMARKNRYRCHQRLMKLLKQQPHLLEMLIG